MHASSVKPGKCMLDARPRQYSKEYTIEMAGSESRVNSLFMPTLKNAHAHEHEETGQNKSLLYSERSEIVGRPVH